MQLSQTEEAFIKNRLIELGATGSLLTELHAHWCIEIESYMLQHNLYFTDGFTTVNNKQTPITKALIAELQQLKFPYVIHKNTYLAIGIFSVVLFVAGLLYKLLVNRFAIGVLLPGYLFTAYVFLPIWFIKQLQRNTDKVLGIIYFLQMQSLLLVIVFWVNASSGKWVAFICWLTVCLFWLWHYYRFKKNQ